MEAIQISINRWMNKQNVVCTYAMEYYSASKMKEILQYAMISMNFEDIMLNEINQSQKFNIEWLHFLGVLETVKMIVIENRMVITKGLGRRENKELFFNG